MTSPLVVTTVCTGNICRSPLAAALLEHHAQALGCLHLDVGSAGTHASAGNPASQLTRELAPTLGVDLTRHRSRPLDGPTARGSAWLLCATATHRAWILERWPDLDAARVALFLDAVPGSAGHDVPDPYGLDRSVYDLAAALTDTAMKSWAQWLADAAD